MKINKTGLGFDKCERRKQKHHGGVLLRGLVKTSTQLVPGSPDSEPIHNPQWDTARKPNNPSAIRING